MLIVQNSLIKKGLLTAGLLLAAAGCGGPSRTDRALNEKDQMIHRQEQELADQKSDNDKLNEQNLLIARQNEKMADNVSVMAKRNAELQMQTDQKVDSLSLQISELEKKLGSQKSGGETQVVVSQKEPGAITIRVANTVLFDAGHAELKPGAYATLEKVAQTLKAQYPDHFIRIEGHTDSTPVVHNKDKFKDNMELSQVRSKAVFDYLIAKGGMPAGRMYTAGYGDSQKIVNPEKTAQDRAANRRVDIVILPNVKVEKQRLAQNGK